MGFSSIKGCWYGISLYEEPCCEGFFVTKDPAAFLWGRRIITGGSLVQKTILYLLVQKNHVGGFSTTFPRTKNYLVGFLSIKEYNIGFPVIETDSLLKRIMLQSLVYRITVRNSHIHMIMLLDLMIKNRTTTRYSLCFIHC